MIVEKKTVHTAPKAFFSFHHTQLVPAGDVDTSKGVCQLAINKIAHKQIANRLVIYIFSWAREQAVSCNRLEQVFHSLVQWIYCPPSTESGIDSWKRPLPTTTSSNNLSSDLAFRATRSILRLRKRLGIDPLLTGRKVPDEKNRRLSSFINNSSNI